LLLSANLLETLLEPWPAGGLLGRRSKAGRSPTRWREREKGERGGEIVGVVRYWGMKLKVHRASGFFVCGS